MSEHDYFFHQLMLIVKLVIRRWKSNELKINKENKEKIMNMNKSDPEDILAKISYVLIVAAHLIIFKELIMAAFDGYSWPLFAFIGGVVSYLSASAVRKAKKRTALVLRFISLILYVGVLFWLYSSS